MWLVLLLILYLQNSHQQINKYDNDFMIQQQQQIQQLLYTKDYDYNQDHKRIIQNYQSILPNHTQQSTVLDINRVFKVHIEQECKEFKTSDKCKDKSCIVYELEDDQVPQYIKSNQMLYNMNSSMDSMNSSNMNNSSNNSNSNNSNMNVDDSIQNGYYYNFEIVPDGNTDYQGQKVWKHLHSIANHNVVVSDMVSGMHTSVSSHITYHYEQIESYIYQYNLQQYKNKISYHNQQQYAEWIRNLYKLENLIGAALKTISQQKQDCLYSLDKLRSLHLEDYKQKPISSDIQPLFNQMYDTLNCVECLKCKINSKIQMLGIITAFQIVNGQIQSHSITHNQFVALMETYLKTIKSIWIFDRMILLIQEDNFYNQLKMFYMKIGGLLVAFMTFGYYFCKHKYMNRQMKFNLHNDNEKETLI